MNKVLQQNRGTWLGEKLQDTSFRALFEDEYRRREERERPIIVIVEGVRVYHGKRRRR